MWRAGKDLEAGSSGGHSGASFFALSAVPGKWEALFVWTLSWFFSFWTLVRPPQATAHTLPPVPSLYYSKKKNGPGSVFRLEHTITAYAMST